MIDGSCICKFDNVLVMKDTEPGIALRDHQDYGIHVEALHKILFRANESLTLTFVESQTSSKQPL
jgi:hypothetical protein